MDTILKLSLDSPSGLVWASNVYSGINHSRLNYRAGDPAGTTVNKDGYYQLRTNNKTYLSHRIVYCLHNKIELSSIKNLVIDHKDGNKLNNHPDNLRLGTSTLNARNRGISSRNKTGVVGVRERDDYWIPFWYDYSGNCQERYLRKDTYTFEYACEVRAKAIEKLNQNGAGYTERHGR